MIKLVTTFCRCDRGSSMVEIAVVMVAALVLMLGMIQFAVAYWYQHNLLLAVEHAGRWAMINNTDTSVASDAALYVCNIVSPGGANCANVAGGDACNLSAGKYCADATTATSSNGTKMLTLSGRYRFSFLNVTGSDLTLTSQTTVPLD